MSKGRVATDELKRWQGPDQMAHGAVGQVGQVGHGRVLDFKYDGNPVEDF